jgi:hypothetical protein
MYPSAVILSNILTIVVVLGALWFARSGYLREQQKVLNRVQEVKALFDHWENWRRGHEEWAEGKVGMLTRAYDSTITHTAQITELDRRLVRWEERELKKLEQTK